LVLTIQLIARSIPFRSAIIACFVGISGFSGHAPAETNATIPPLSASSKAAAFQQLQSGKRIFERSCTACHNLDANQAAPTSLRGPSFISRWNTARDLFGKISETMPANQVASLSTNESLALVAYLVSLNGHRSDGRALTNERAQLLNVQIAGRANRSSATAAIGEDPTGLAYYTDAQADRGGGYFQGSCGLCHVADAHMKPRDTGGIPAIFVPATAPEGLSLGTMRVKLNLAGTDFLKNYATVGDIYNKSSTTMPGYDAYGLSPGTYADIVAYVLRANGLPAGTHDLQPDVESMHAMPIVEPGFTKLFNGRDLSGWKAMLGHNCAAPPDGCGSANPAPTFTVQSNSIHVSGKPLGYLYTEKKYLNFSLRMDYRYTQLPGVPISEPFLGNSGWLLFIQKNQVWPKMIEIQGMEATVMDVLPVDASAKFTVDPAARKLALRPLQWNSIEIVSEGGRVEAYLNGVRISEITEHEFKAPGYIGLQSEGGQISFRNIRIREE
jgi:mono/diheme cytochrome c family protein